RGSKGALTVLAHLIVGISGLLMVIAVPLTVAIPYSLRRGLFPEGILTFAGKSREFLQRMRPHYWLGYVLAALTLLHAVLAVPTGVAVDINPLGIPLAALGLFILLFQLTLGNQLTRPDRPDDPNQPQRGALRALHFWTMVTLVILGLGHILL